ncbi:MAG TPA: hypothetical protein VEK34_07480 [Methylocella sp.]|nr:hypothetical protein [Methylocella sp.]
MFFPTRRVYAPIALLFLGALLLSLRSDGSPIAPAIPLSKAVARQKITLDDTRARSWEWRWRLSLLPESQSPYCATGTGEDWTIPHLLMAYYYAYRATADQQWIDRLDACADRWISRAEISPDDYPGWPKTGASGTNVDDLGRLYTESLLGEAMALRPLVMMARVILEKPDLKAVYGEKAQNYLRLSRSIFEKWDKRGAWRRVGEDGMISVVLPLGIDRASGQWMEGFAVKDTLGHGFSHQANKANLIACWLLAMADATGDPAYRERAGQWFRVMKSRLKRDDAGDAFRLWNYWEPAGEWDYKGGGAPKHWVGIHPNPGYYGIDAEAMVTAFEHGVVFGADDIRCLINTALKEQRHWPALAPYDSTIRQHFEETLKPEGWEELRLTPWYLMLAANVPD